MDINDCIRFTNENRICYFATTDRGRPRVRALGFWFADESGFYFQTGSIKDLYHQLKVNPWAEVCFYRPEDGMGTMLRISGEIEFLEDKKLKERVMKERPFLRSFGLTADSPGLVIFRIPHGEAHFWTMEKNLKPKKIICF